MAPWLEHVMQDIRIAARSLRRAPSFTLVAVATLALGIGLNATVFSIVNAVLLRPLSYPESERMLWVTKQRTDIDGSRVPRVEFAAWKEQTTSFERMVAYNFYEFGVQTASGVTQARGVLVSDDFWSLAAVRAAHGRLPQRDEADVVLLSYDFFERRFNGNVNVVGQVATRQEDRRPLTIIGVLPRGFVFEFPASEGRAAWNAVELDTYEPMAITPLGYAAAAVGTLKPGVSIEQAQSELAVISARVAFARPRDNEGDFRIKPLLEHRVGAARLALWILFSAVAFVLLIACANMANLLLARAVVRQREIAIRRALGAQRGHVIRQFFTESLLLTLAGGASGVLLASWSLALVLQIVPDSIPRLTEARLEVRVLGFALGLTVVTAFLFGLGPAMVLMKLRLQDLLRNGSAAMSTAAGRLRARKLLVVGQLALAVVLLTAAGLMVKSFSRMYAHPPGFNPERILLTEISVTLPGGGTALYHTYFEQLMERVRAVPGVEAAAITKRLRGTPPPWDITPPLAPGQQPPTNASETVSASYRETMGLRLVRGRWFDETERALVINESLARRDFPGIDPIGHHMVGALPTPIVGVVADVRYSKLDAAVEPAVYTNYIHAQRLDGPATLVVRTAGDAAAVAATVHDVAANVDDRQPIITSQTLEQALADSIAPRRFNLLLLGTFATAALFLAALGIYGVVAYTVAQRSSEIGVRMALGATRPQIAAMVIREGMAVALIGTAIGLASARAMTQVTAGLLYDVEPTDPLTFASTALVLVGAMLIACWRPALRASRVDPLVALRAD